MLIKLTIRRADGSGVLVYQGLVNTRQLGPDRRTVLNVEARGHYEDGGFVADRIGLHIPWAVLGPGGPIVMGDGILIELIEVAEPTTGETKMTSAPPTKPDVDEQLKLAHDDQKPVIHPVSGRVLSYQEGVVATIQWMMGEIETKPMGKGQ